MFFRDNRLEENNNDIGLEEFIGTERGLTFIEWPMYISHLLPDDVITINIKNIGDDNREITLEGIEICTL